MDAAPAHLITQVFYRHESIGWYLVAVCIHPCARPMRLAFWASAATPWPTDAYTGRPNIYGGQSQISGVLRAPFD